MNVVEPGKIYTVFTAEGKPVEIVFCHNRDGAFQDGITSEELIKVLVDRHRGFMEIADSTENLNVFTHLKQAQTWMAQRTLKKWQRNKNKSKA